MASQVILKKSSVAARVPVAGDLAFGELALNYTDGLLYYKKSDGTTIASLGGSPTATATYTRTAFTATAAQTIFAVTYTVGYIEVYYNGVLQPAAEYTATNGTSVTLTIPALVNDIIEVIAYNTTAIFNVTSSQIITALGYTPAAVTPRSAAFNSLSIIAPNSDTLDQYSIRALAVAATIAAPTGTPVDGQKLTLRIKDNGIAQTLAWTTSIGAYRVIGTTLPTTTVASKTMYIGCIYNITDSYWDVVSVAQQA